MKRITGLMIAVAMFTICADAKAGPLQRFRERIQQRRAERAAASPRVQICVSWPPLRITGGVLPIRGQLLPIPAHSRPIGTHEAPAPVRQFVPALGGCPGGVCPIR